MTNLDQKTAAWSLRVDTPSGPTTCNLRIMVFIKSTAI